MSNVGNHRVSEEELEGALFDVDGTLVDSMPRFFPSWNVAGEKYGISLTEDQFYSYGGWPLPDIVRDLHRRRYDGKEATEEWVAQFLKEKKAAHAEREKINGPPPRIDATAKIARALKARGVKVAAATSGLRDHVEPHLKAAGLDDLFPSELIICAADLPKGRGKPKPDIFLRAAKLIGADPTKCRAYEDAESGLRSAYEAGCEVIDVRDLENYPLPDGLRKAMAVARAKRDWLKVAEVDGSAAAAATTGSQGQGEGKEGGAAAE